MASTFEFSCGRPRRHRPFSSHNSPARTRGAARRTFTLLANSSKPRDPARRFRVDKMSAKSPGTAMSAQGAELGLRDLHGRGKLHPRGPIPVVRSVGAGLERRNRSHEALNHRSHCHRPRAACPSDLAEAPPLVPGDRRRRGARVRPSSLGLRPCDRGGRPSVCGTIADGSEPTTRLSSGRIPAGDNSGAADGRRHRTRRRISIDQTGREATDSNPANLQNSWGGPPQGEEWLTYLN
jgi:hypothetical protein